MLNDLKNAIADIPNQRKKPFDRSLFMIVCCLCIFGIIMIWSASMYNAKLDSTTGYDEFYYVKKQLTFFLAGITVAYIISLLNVKYIKRLSPVLMAAIVVMLFIVSQKPEGDAVNGAVRYISIAGIVIQPAEFAKLAVLLFLPYMAEKYISEIKSLKAFILVFAFLSIVTFLIYVQPALSSAAIVAATIIAIYFIAGGNMFFITFTVVFAVGAGVVFIATNPWRLERFFAYLDPFEDLLNAGWQPAQSLMALGSGGFWGQGIGNGRSKLSFLPEPHNDYIFSIIGEELGFVGCVGLIVVYFILIVKIFIVAFNSKDIFSRTFTAGTAVLLAIQVFFHIGVDINLIPATGIILPFISYGGSSMLSFMMIFGFVLGISRDSNLSTIRKKSRERK